MSDTPTPTPAVAAERRDFAFVLNRLDVQATLPVEIIDGYLLRRASTVEIEQIEAGLKLFGGWGDQAYRYKVRTVITKTDGGEAHGYEDIPPEQWKFYVVEKAPDTLAPSVNDGALRVEAASRLHETELDLGLHFMSQGLMSSYVTRGFSDDAGMRLEHGSLLDAAMLESIRATDRALTALQAANPGLARSYELFRQTLTVDRGHPLQVLGMFAVMESLLTHEPDGETDSLTRQIRTKMPLLDQRFAVRLDYTQFGKLPPDRVWSRLYKCRSQIAHGGELDFRSALKELGDLGKVESFMRTACKKLLLHTLKEPQLVVALRQC